MKQHIFLVSSLDFCKAPGCAIDQMSNTQLVLGTKILTPSVQQLC